MIHNKLTIFSGWGQSRGPLGAVFWRHQSCLAIKGQKNGCGECNYPLGNLKLLRIFMGAKADLNFAKKQWWPVAKPLYAYLPYVFASNTHFRYDSDDREIPYSMNHGVIKTDYHLRFEPGPPGNSTAGRRWTSKRLSPLSHGNDISSLNTNFVYMHCFWRHRLTATSIEVLTCNNSINRY